MPARPLARRAAAMVAAILSGLVLGTSAASSAGLLPSARRGARPECPPIAVSAPAPSSGIIRAAHSAQQIAAAQDAVYTSRTFSLATFTEALRAAEPRLRIAREPTVAGARRNDTVYIITTATHGRHLRLASAINPGLRYIATDRDGRLRFQYWPLRACRVE